MGLKKKNERKRFYSKSAVNKFRTKHKTRLSEYSDEEIRNIMARVDELTAKIQNKWDE